MAAKFPCALCDKPTAILRKLIFEPVPNEGAWLICQTCRDKMDAMKSSDEAWAEGIRIIHGHDLCDDVPVIHKPPRSKQ